MTGPKVSVVLKMKLPDIDDTHALDLTRGILTNNKKIKNKHSNLELLSGGDLPGRDGSDSLHPLKSDSSRGRRSSWKLNTMH